MIKMKKLLAMLCAVLSVLFLASAFASPHKGRHAISGAEDNGGDNVVHWDRIVGLITALNVDNPVGTISSGTFPWTTRSGDARVDLSTGAVFWRVDGLAINGAVFSGTPGPITAVVGTLVCGAGTNTETAFDTDAVPLGNDGDAQFSGRFGTAPGTCGNPIFLIRIAAGPPGAAGRWIATGASPF